MAPPTYSLAELETAISAINAGEISTSKASRVFKIPKSTLIKKKRESVIKIQKPGSAPVLQPDEEDVLVTWIEECMKQGFPRPDGALIDAGEDER